MGNRTIDDFCVAQRQAGMDSDARIGRQPVPLAEFGGKKLP
ncbi:hypothetical protein [Shimia sediminis]|nr:hypothetical protein [Shimia sediminis]